MTRNEIARMRAVQDPLAVAQWAAHCPHVREALRECIARGAQIPVSDRMNDEQTMEWLTAHFAGERGRAELARDMLADWRGEAPPADLEVRTANAEGLCRVLDSLPGPILSNNEQLSVLAVAVESLFAAFARVTGKANVWRMPAGRSVLH